MPSKLTLLFMLDYVDSGGGATRMMLWVASSMADYGCKVEVCSVSYSEFLKANVSSNCVYHSFDAPLRTAQQKRKGIEEASLVARIRSHIEAVRPDIVVSFGGHEFYYAFLLRRVCGYKLLVSERTDPYHPRSRGDKLRRSLYNYADYAVFQTPEAMRFFPPRIQKRSSVIPNPAKSTFAERWHSHGNRAIVTLSRIDFSQKRLDVVVDALGLMEEKAELHIYGNGSQAELDKLGAMINASPVKSRIYLMGPADSPEIAFEDADVYVLCSDFEGIPNTVMEALSFGIPIISTDCSPGGARLLLGSGKYGTIVPRGDAQALAHALDRYFQDPSASVAMAEAGAASIDRFSEERIAQAWLYAFCRMAGVC